MLTSGDAREILAKVEKTEALCCAPQLCSVPGAIFRDSTATPEYDHFSDWWKTNARDLGLGSKAHKSDHQRFNHTATATLLRELPSSSSC